MSQFTASLRAQRSNPLVPQRVERLSLGTELPRSLRSLAMTIVLPLLFLSACTQTQLGAHVGKQVFNESQTKGYFKVGSPYRIKGKKYYPKETYNLTETGTASWYGPNFHGKQTANGEIFNKYELTAAHRTLQMPSLIEVTNLKNGKSVILRVNDRGPFAHDRVLDVSEKGAELLGFKNQGTAKVRIKVLKEESAKLAEIAKGGKNTRGMEVAYNEQRQAAWQPVKTSLWQKTKGIFGNNTQTANHSLDPLANGKNTSITMVHEPVDAPIKLASIDREVIYAEPATSATSIPGKVDTHGRFLPTPVVKNTLNPTGGIFIQAGSFGNATNANKLSGRLGSIAPANVSPVDVNGNTFHRVRLGPFESMAQAHSALSRVSATGQNNAMILVE